MPSLTYWNPSRNSEGLHDSLLKLSRGVGITMSSFFSPMSMAMDRSRSWSPDRFSSSPYAAALYLHIGTGTRSSSEQRGAAAVKDAYVVLCCKSTSLVLGKQLRSHIPLACPSSALNTDANFFDAVDQPVGVSEG